jgi:hypothetical protein
MITSSQKNSFAIYYYGCLVNYALIARCLEIKGVRVILNKLSSYLLIKRGWFNGEKTNNKRGQSQFKQINKKINKTPMIASNPKK